MSSPTPERKPYICTYYTVPVLDEQNMPTGMSRLHSPKPLALLVEDVKALLKTIHDADGNNALDLLHWINAEESTLPMRTWRVRGTRKGVDCERMVQALDLNAAVREASTGKDHMVVRDCVLIDEPQRGKSVNMLEMVTSVCEGANEGYLVRLLARVKNEPDFRPVVTLKYLSDKDMVYRVSRAINDALIEGQYVREEPPGYRPPPVPAEEDSMETPTP